MPATRVVGITITVLQYAQQKFTDSRLDIESQSV